MFCGLLDWIRPTDNNAQLSRKLNKVIQRIIDRVFDTFRPLNDSDRTQQIQSRRQIHCPNTFINQDAVEQNVLTVPEGQADDTSEMDPIDDMDWFNTVDWTQGTWLEQNNLQ